MRRLRWCGVLAALMLAAAACGGTDPETGGGGLEVTAVWSGTEQERFEKVLEAFTAKTGTAVTYTSAGDDIATKIRTAIEGGSPPALAVLPQPGLMRDLAGQGVLNEIEDVVGAAVDESYAADWRTLGTVDGKLYGLFFKGANKSTVWYNVAAFKDAGVSAPATWADLLKAMATLKAAGTTPLSVGGGDAWTLTDWFENIYLRTAGPEKYDQLTRHEIPWTDESVKQALATFADVLKDKSLIAGDPSAVKFVESVDAVFKTPPDAAMVYEGDFVPGVTTQADAKPKETFDVFDFPSIEGSSPSVVGGGDVVVMLQDTPEARALLEFLATAEAAEVWAKLGGFSSPNTKVDQEVYPDDISRQTASALANAQTFRFDMSDLAPAEFGGTPGRGMWLILQEFAKDPSDVNATAQRLEEAAAAAYA